jgi:hypothetical protein
MAIPRNATWRLSLHLRRTFSNFTGTRRIIKLKSTELDVGEWLKIHQLPKDNWSEDAKLVLRALSLQKIIPEKAILNNIQKRLERAGFFKIASPDLMQLFLENFSFAKCTNSIQEQLHSYLASFLETGKYSVIMKIGLCLRILELASEEPSEGKRPQISNSCCSLFV